MPRKRLERLKILKEMLYRTQKIILIFSSLQQKLDIVITQTHKKFSETLMEC